MKKKVRAKERERERGGDRGNLREGGGRRERGREELKGRRPNATGSWIRSEARNYSNWLVYEIFMFRKFRFTRKSIYLLLSILSFDFF